MALNDKKLTRLQDHLDMDGEVTNEALAEVLRLNPNSTTQIEAYLSKVAQDEGDDELLARYRKANATPASDEEPAEPAQEASTSPSVVKSQQADERGPRGAKGEPGEDPNDDSALAFEGFRFSVRDPETKLHTALQVRTYKKNRVVLEPVPQEEPPEDLDEPKFVNVVVSGEMQTVALAEVRSAGEQFTLPNGKTIATSKIQAAVEAAL